MLPLKRRLLGRLLVGPFSPDKIQWVQRRVLQSAVIWTARWTISLIIAVLPSLLLGTSDRDVLIVSPMMCGSFGLRIRYADVISVSTEHKQADLSDVHKPVSPTNLSHNAHTHAMSSASPCLQR